MTKAKKRVYIENTTSQAEEAANGENKDRCTRSPSLSAASTAKPQTHRLWINREGYSLRKQEARWAENFSEVLNRPKKSRVLTETVEAIPQQMVNVESAPRFRFFHGNDIDHST